MLDENLRLFYAEAKTKGGDDYSRATLLSLRNGIERYRNSAPYNKGLTIANNPKFKKSNIILNAKIKSLKMEGKEKAKHKSTIEEDDLSLLQSSGVFLLSNPLSMLRNVWFNITLYWCRRGREGQRALTKNSFVFFQDASGDEYVTMVHNEVSKNHPGGVNDHESFESQGRMYKTTQENDGYTALKLYLSKLNPECEALFQYPKRRWNPTDRVWYENRPLGVNKLGDMMKDISSAAKLSQVYTNHCVRATSITLWSNAGLPNRHIMAISGHRNEQSLQHYNQRPSTSQLKLCSNVLSEALGSGSTQSTMQQSTTKKSHASQALISQAPVKSLQSVSVSNYSSSSTSTSETVIAENPLNFASLFANCSIGNVNVNFSLQQ